MRRCNVLHGLYFTDDGKQSTVVVGIVKLTKVRKQPSALCTVPADIIKSDNITIKLLYLQYYNSTNSLTRQRRSYTGRIMNKMCISLFHSHKV